MAKPKLTRFANWRLNLEDLEAVEVLGGDDGLTVRVYLKGVGVELKGRAANAFLMHMQEDAPGGPSITLIEREAA